MDLFPYKYRPYQKEIVESIRNCLEKRKHLVLESGTGSGKTICALSAVLPFARDNEKKIVYATRTNAQQRQVILEFRAIKKSFPTETQGMLAVALQGRSHMCLLVRNNPSLEKGSADELARLCAQEKKKARRNEDGCEFFRNCIRNIEEIDKAIEWIKENLPLAEEVLKYCEERKICPYEISRNLVGDALMVVVPYIYVFDSTLRNLLLDWLGVSEEDVILIIDEAHNLPDYLRDLMSTYLSMYALNNCLNEVENHGDISILQGKLSIYEFVEKAKTTLEELRKEFLGELNDEEKDALLPPGSFIEELFEKIDVDTKEINLVIDALIAYGEQVKRLKESEGKLPRSYIYRLGEFLSVWNTAHEDFYIRLIVDQTNGKNPRLELYCLDPSVGGEIIHRFYTSIHMSGTLSPLDEYKDSLGLPEDTDLISFPSPFQRKNRKVIYVGNVTTKYDELKQKHQLMDRIESYICSICNSFKRNTIVFFPSFELMNAFLDRKITEKISRKVYVEKREMKQSELMDIVRDFKSSKGSILFSVIGGRISEGMDFPAEELEIAIVVGIPYPKPTARQRGLQRYYQKKFGKGWEYTVKAPTARKLLQAIGRLIRSETDRGIAIILDRRAPRFRGYIRDLTLTRNPVHDIEKFFLS